MEAGETGSADAEARLSRTVRIMAGGTLWMVAMRWTIRLVGLVNTAILARLLTPGDFGLVAVAMVAVDLVITLTDGDIEMALVRSREWDRALTDTGWTLKIIAGGLTSALLMAGAPQAADWLGDARLAAIIRIAALRPFLLGFENIGVVAFRRTLRFALEFRYMVAQRLATFALGLALAWLFRDYRALAWFGPAAALITVAISFLMVRGRPRLSLSRWRDFWVFSRWQMLFNAARLMGERCDPFAVNRLAGAAEAGLYAVAFDLAMMPTREIMLPAGRALLPAYARIADDPQELRTAFSTMLGFAALVAAAIGIGMSCIAEDAVLVVLGESWRDAVPFVRWLGIFGALEGLWLMLDPYFIAARRERALALSNVLLAGLTVPVVILVAHRFGIAWIPAARIAVMAAGLAAILSRLTAWRWCSCGQLLNALWPPAAAAAAMAGVLRLTHHALTASPLPSMALDIMLGAAAFIATLLLLWRLPGRPAGAERILIEMAASRLAAVLDRLGRPRRRSGLDMIGSGEHPTGKYDHM